MILASELTVEDNFDILDKDTTMNLSLHMSSVLLLAVMGLFR